MASADIYDRLKADHDKQRAMLKDLGELRGDTKKRQALFERFRLEMESHAAAEEESLYATMLANPELRDDARHSVSEHKEVDDVIGKMLAMDFASDEWEENFHHMRRRYEHHIDEEEDEMFPAAAKELDAATEERLGEVYAERKPEELELARENPPEAEEKE
ncbi:MAG: hemerythrin domain-containing protein [Sphingomonas sp.]|uniref:hemerythrin domain-containing protein n=1 Tax=Sphingomonas sp. TaxID=28214 RepID=UPI001AC456EA|nr:hemerythrin domain-containing protein [Sphingomonas sp.]MBN8809003.1 hemerythrin domain-containing protein [Sphingomonas sp.]